MKLLTLILCVTTTIVASIRVSSNGNSPEIKMIGGMMVDIKKNLVPMTPRIKETPINSNYNKSRRLNNNLTKLSINERYRRLIPYMTFYYANDLVTPTTEAYIAKDVEVEKAEIIEATTIRLANDRQPKKIIFSQHKNIPRYQGNRLTQYNIASANPRKNFYGEIVPVNQNTVRVIPNYNPLLTRQPSVSVNAHNYDNTVQKHVIKAPSAPFAIRNRAPYINIYNNEESPNIRYYLDEKEQSPRFKLVPYEQTPPVVVSPNVNYYNDFKKPIPGLGIRDPVHIKPKPTQTQVYYDNVNIQQTMARKQPPPTNLENYYEKRQPHPVLVQPVIESGFKPITSPPLVTTEIPRYTSIPSETPLPYFESVKQPPMQGPFVTSTTSTDASHFQQNYYQYMAEEVTSKPSMEQANFKPILEQPIYQNGHHSSSNAVTLGDLINSLQLNKSIPKPITRENVGASIRTLLQVLNALRAAPIENNVDSISFSTPKPIATTDLIETTGKPLLEVTSKAISEGDYDEEYLPPVKTPSQYLEDFPSSGGTSQQFPLPVTSDDEGGTPGRPGVDYPILTTIPPTSFDCKTQRYKGFFADTETRCQVWHYCDLNGGQASFLCPNGTIFSQAALTCDWWFNVKCSSAAQLYVLNESLYKFILPHSPKFPEDYSGPLVDKYLTLKFKEMEEQFKKNKKKITASDKMDDDNDSTETKDYSNEESVDSEQSGESGTSDLNASSVIVESPGMSGNVERLADS